MAPGTKDDSLPEGGGRDLSSDRAEAPSGGAGVAPAALLRAEIERLKAELAAARLKIAELELHADVDPLLDIFNRRGFERELKRSLAYVKRHGTPAVLVYIDLDGFKAINDAHGHAAGDALLKAVAGALTACVRASDVVARLGGDEFGILMWNAAEGQAAIRAADLEQRIEALRLPHGEAQLAVGASAGVASLRGDLDATGLIDAADKAMYARKRERRR
jgi:diguanylate cyclase (GGDEF)-like protein